jgi:hypothetical protein
MADENTLVETERSQRNKIFIEPEYVIVELLEADKKKYLTVSRLCHFVVYLRQQLSKMTEMPPESEVIFDISFNSIERTVRYYNHVFDMIGDTIIVKEGELPVPPENVKKFLPKYVQEFTEKYAA